MGVKINLFDFYSKIRILNCYHYFFTTLSLNVNNECNQSTDFIKSGDKKDCIATG
jgi:hypothetical protein